MQMKQNVSFESFWWSYDIKKQLSEKIACVQDEMESLDLESGYSK